MTRRMIIKRTYQYLVFYVFWVLALGAILTMICNHDYKVWKLQKDSLTLIIPIFIVNLTVYYRYLYDVLKKNIYEATIIELDENGKREMNDILGRVMEGTTVGKNRRTPLLKPRRKTDYVFKIRGGISDHGCLPSTIRIKYLKYSKMIVEVKVVRENIGQLFQYSKKEKDYIISPFRIGMMNLPNTMEEANELTKEGIIEHITYPFRERMRRIIGGVVYSILAGSLIFVYQNLLLIL